MKALTLWEPYATLIAEGYKRYETRSWGTKYRGLVAICAAKRKLTKLDREGFDDFEIEPWRSAALGTWLTGQDDPPYGKVVCVALLNNCFQMTWPFVSGALPDELEFGDFRVGRYAWDFGGKERLPEPVPIIGRQRLFNVDAETERQIMAQIEH